MHMDLKTATEILKVEANAPLSSVTKVYHKLALKMHPDKCRNDPRAQEKFTQLQKAYDFIKKYNKLSPKDSSASKSEPAPVQQPEPNEFDVSLSLEEIFAGCTKEKEITIKIVDANGKTTKKSKTLNVVVNRGAIGGSRIVIPQKGDEYHGQIPANVVFIVREKPHKHFKRTRFDLEYTARLTTEQACSRKVEVPNIENPKNKLRVRVDQLITQSTVERLKGKGMPIPSNTKERGDLVLRFDIIYEKDKRQDPPIEYDLMLTLEQILKSFDKNMKIKRKVVNPFDGTQKAEDKILTVSIPAGVESGKKFTFEKEGDQRPESIPADIVFIVKIASHLHFIRQGQDILYTALVSESEKRKGYTLEIPTLDGEIITEQITRDSMLPFKHYPDKGLPIIAGEPNKRGNLIVNFRMVSDNYVDKPIERDLPLTLKKILHGFTKSIKITRIIMDRDNNERREEKNITITVKPGTESGHRYTFPRMGNQYPGYIPADLVWVVQDKEHPQFRRRGANIQYTARVSKDKLASGGTLEIPTLEGDSLKLSLENVLKFDAVKKFPGRGLPWPEDPNKRGNLLVQFEIIENEKKEKEKKETEKPKTEKSKWKKMTKVILENDKGNAVKDQIIKRDLLLTEEEMINGATKKMKITRKIEDADGNSRDDGMIVIIEIKPGTKIGEQFTFPQIGDQAPGRIPADVVFVVKRKEVASSSKQFDTFGRASMRRPKDASVEHELPLTLENILHGCKKKMKINRIITDEDGDETHQDELVVIDIRPGTEAGSRFIFKEMGNSYPGRTPGDIVFVASDKPHDKFVRKGADIEYKASYSEDEQLAQLQIPTLEGSTLPFVVSALNKETKVHRIVQRGLPLPGNPKQRGDLVIHLRSKQEAALSEVLQRLFKNKNF